MESQKSDWHNRSEEALTTSLHVDVKRGLDKAEVQRRLDQYGPNHLTPRRGKNPLRLLLEQFNQPLVYILS